VLQRTGVVELPLHYGHCPPWLFKRMKRLGKAIAETIVFEFGQKEFLQRISDPFFFQSLGCVLGFDWHSSGVTTTVCGALKEGINSSSTGIGIAGGKGRASKNTLREIKEIGENLSLSEKRLNELMKASKLSAKVDNTLIQDSYCLYHHSFFFNEKGNWAVIQQGLNNETNYARRYHWISEKTHSFVVEPHKAICCNEKKDKALNLVARESEETRKTILDLVKENPVHLKKFFSIQKTLFDFEEKETLFMDSNHFKLSLSKKSFDSLKKAFEFQPKNFEELVSLQGIGEKTFKALALISELVFGATASWKDPVKYSFAHGGKDGVPFPVNKRVLDESINTLEQALNEAKLGEKERIQAIKRLHEFIKA
jgi:hypothetical protein